MHGDRVRMSRRFPPPWSVDDPDRKLPRAAVVDLVPSVRRTVSRFLEYPNLLEPAVNRL
jgi:hypothetical protein